MLEISTYLVIVGGMGVTALHGYESAQRHLHVVQGLGLVAGARLTMMEFRAVRGEWPTSNAEAGFSEASRMGKQRVDAVQIRAGGAIDVRLSHGALDGKVFSVRAAQSPGTGLPVAWICGHANVAPGMRAASDATTVSSHDLPSPCRPHR